MTKRGGMGLLAVFIISLIAIAVLSAVQYAVFGYGQPFLEGMLLNLITDILMMVVTVFILERLIREHYKQEERKKYLNTLGSRHESLAAKLEYSYLHFVTKVPSQFFPRNEDRRKDTKLVDVTNGLENFVTKDFTKRNYKVNLLDPYDITKVHTGEVSYQLFLKHEFRDKILQMTKEYTNRYIAILPKDILESLFKIEDLLNSGLFAVPEDHGLNADLSNAKFGIEAIQQMIDSLEKIGKEIIKIKEYA